MLYLLSLRFAIIGCAKISEIASLNVRQHYEVSQTSSAFNSKKKSWFLPWAWKHCRSSKLRLFRYQDSRISYLTYWYRKTVIWYMFSERKRIISHSAVVSAFFSHVFTLFFVVVDLLNRPKIIIFFLSYLLLSFHLRVVVFFSFLWFFSSFGIILRFR